MRSPKGCTGFPDMVANSVSRKALGYGDLEPSPVPAQLIRLINDGLDPDVNLSVEFVKPLG